ncbi:MAG: tubulin-like doman-containing protein [Prochloraceae cyanobacterium]
MVNSSNNERQSRGIKRTICIGLGGTGRDVLMRIRRLIVERHGDLNRLPIVSFVYIDTDKAASQTSDLRTGNKHYGVDLSFRDAEKVNATMNRTEINNFVRGLQNKSSYERQGPYDHIGRWFPPQLLKDIKAIEEGAKGIRPVGRLAFFNKYRQIKKAIQTAESRTRGKESILLNKGLIVEPGLNIFVVGSLCGGTGSGMFLDVAYSLRRDFGDIGAQLFGYLVISPELYGNTPSMNANTYAALKELNHYTTTGTKFEACYDPQNLAIVQESRPPFDYVYLVSNETTGEYKIVEKSKLSNVIARKIALDFSSELSPVVKGMRDNFLQHMLRWDEHPRPNVQRYLSFGMAEIYFPRDKIVQIALSHISLEVLKFWLYGEGQSPEAQDLLDKFILNWNSGLTGKDCFSIKLEQTVQEGQKNFINALNFWKNKLDNAISKIETKEDRLKIRNLISKELRQEYRKVQPSEMENNRGIWLTKLQQIQPKIKDQFKNDIAGFLGELLTPGNYNFSINSARSWLEALITKLNDYQSNLEEQKREQKPMYSQQYIEKQWKDIEEIIEEIEQKSGFLNRNSQRQKNSQVQEQTKRAVTEAYKAIKHNFDCALVEASLKIVKELQKYVRETTTQITNFNSLIKNSIAEYKKEEDEQKQRKLDDEMSGEAIFTDRDLDNCYKIIIPEEERSSELVLLSKKIAEKIGGQVSLNSLVNQYLEAKELQKEINETVDSIFGSRSLNLVQSVIKRFVENYSIPHERSIRLEQILQESNLLLPIDLSAPYFYNDTGKSMKVIGFKDLDDRAVKQFKNALIEDLGIAKSVLKPTQAEDEVVIVNEYAGFPLRVLNCLPQMRQQYIRQQNYGVSFLHNDYRTIFTDIIPPEAQKIEALEDIFYPCLALELLAYNSQTEMFEFQYYDRMRGKYNTAYLSSVWSEALEQLANKQDMAEELQNILENAIAEIESSPTNWEDYYLPKVREFVVTVDELTEASANYPYKAKVVGTREGQDNLFKEGIIHRFWNKMEELLKTKVPALPANSIPNNRLIQAANSTPEQHLIVEPIVNNNEDNRSKRRAEIKQLKEDLEDGILTLEEYDRLKVEILAKYPV